MQRWRPRLAPDFIAAARTYWPDLISALVLFAFACIAAGRVWRFPFDDEVYTLGKIEQLSLRELLLFYLKGHDVHPPLSYLLFGALHDIGLVDGAMRLVSLAMTALALMLFQLLALMLIARRDGDVPSLSRLVAVLLFGLNALAVSQGDALRWYPLFACEVALFMMLYVAGANTAARLASAAMLGLAASTNFLTALVIAPLALYRYGLQRRPIRGDIGFWLVVLVFGSFGLCAAFYLFDAHYRLVGTQLGIGVVQAALTDALGFFGGHALGIGQTWMIVPAIAIAVPALLAQIDRKEPANPAHLLVLMLVAVLVMPLIGFAKPRSFLYLAPAMATLLTLYLDRQVRRHAGVAVVLTALLVAPAVVAIAAIETSRHPFKRASVIPYGAVLDFIRTNEDGRVLVLSTDPVVPWTLDHDAHRPGRCTVYLVARPRCLEAAGAYDTVFIVSGHTHVPEDSAAMNRFKDTAARVSGGKRKIATLHAGIDEDAALKSRLSGVPLSREILTIELYR